VKQFITDEETEVAVHYLASSAEKHARAKAKMKYLEKHVKSVLAIESLKKAGKSNAANKTLAEASKAYQDILAEYEIAVYEFTLVDDKRFAAESTIEAWKVISYSLRRGNI
jgi:leucyl aminopeptidase (aminopeptidase T)